MCSEERERERDWGSFANFGVNIMPTSYSGNK